MRVHIVSRLIYPLLLLAGLACNSLVPAGPPPTPTPPPAYLGQFDCYGAENGMGAYAGRISLQPGGGLTFKDYDNAQQTGTWLFSPATQSLSFKGTTSLDSAVYQPAADLLVVTLLPNAQTPHAEGGTLSCMRAKPGITGPP